MNNYDKLFDPKTGFGVPQAREAPGGASAHQPCETQDGRGAFAGVTGWLPLVQAQREYIELLTAELSEATPLLAIHGWTSKRFVAGRLAREKIAKAEAAANAASETRRAFPEQHDKR